MLRLIGRGSHSNEEGGERQWLVEEGGRRERGERVLYAHQKMSK